MEPGAPRSHVEKRSASWLARIISEKQAQSVEDCREEHSTALEDVGADDRGVEHRMAACNGHCVDNGGL